MRALTAAEAEVLRACAAPVDTAMVAADFDVFTSLLEAKRVTVTWEPHPTLPGYEIARFDATDLGRLALRFAVPSPHVSP